jgi:hypothetical protein
MGMELLARTLVSNPEISRFSRRCFLTTSQTREQTELFVGDTNTIFDHFDYIITPLTFGNHWYLYITHVQRSEGLIESLSIDCHNSLKKTWVKVEDPKTDVYQKIKEVLTN